ncbi:MAG TPA: hypothetical protein VHC49_20430, partial [Mycobacteriales bacterium]|nr:hypothetical protein [Mycobacteriales bacterium]
MPTRNPGRDDQPLFQELQRTLRSGEPLDLLAVVCGFLEVTDARSADPFGGQERPSRGDLIESFIGTPAEETTAALTAMHALVPDEPTKAWIGGELSNRWDPMPGWLSALARAEIEPDVWFLTHILGDGDDYLFGVRLPTGQALSALVYVDHNLGTVVKDAFVVPEELEDLAIKLGRSLDDADQSLTRTDAATARAVVSDAIERGSRIYPPLTSDSWPMCRPLVEWMLRQLPAGGAVPQPKTWSEQEAAAIAAEFFASPFGAPFADDDDHRRLGESILRFGTSYASGDPFRWSPVTVELLLADWMPRKIMAAPQYLAKLPELLRAFIRYCHQRVGIRVALTENALAAVDHYEPEYLRRIETARFEESADVFEPEDDPDTEELERAVGGPAQLQSLDTEPLPDEPFEWAGISDDIRPVVEETLGAC